MLFERPEPRYYFTVYCSKFNYGTLSTRDCHSWGSEYVEHWDYVTVASYFEACVRVNHGVRHCWSTWRQPNGQFGPWTQES